MDAELDYGHQDQEEPLTRPPATAGDLDMADADHHDGVQQERERTIVDGELPGTKLYRLPADEAVRVGAERGITARHGTNDELMGDAEPVELPEPPVPIGAALDIRLNVLHLSGSPITQCSTSRIFAFLTHHHAQPLGLEWIDDSSCNVVFASPEAALLGVEYLCPASDPSAMTPPVALPGTHEMEALFHVQKAHRQGSSEGSQMDATSTENEVVASLLQPRLAHRVPGHLYTAVERETALELSKLSADSDLPSDAPEIYRELEQEERLRKLETPEAKKLKALRGNLYVRFALDSLDVKASRASKQSQWYAEHGNQGGRDVVTKLLTVGAPGERVELLGQALPQPPLGGAATSRARGRGAAGKTAMDELDGQLESYQADRDSEPALTKAEEEEREVEGRWSRNSQSDTRRARGGGGEGRRNQAMRMDRLDEEMDAWNRRERDRSASPGRRGGGGRSGGGRGGGDRAKGGGNGNGNGNVKIRGRGAMRAPRVSAWGEDEGDEGGDDLFAGQRYGGEREAPVSLSLSGRMALGDDEERRDRGRRRRGGERDRGTSEAKGGGANLLDRLGAEAGQERRLEDRLN